MTRYVVLVYPALPTREESTKRFYEAGSVSTKTGPTVVRVTARSVESALNEAKVPSGGHALIVEESKMRRFDRAKQAPLAERAPDGNPLDEVAENAA